MKKIKIGFSMIFYPVTMGGYILRALKRRKDVELWTVGPFTGSWIPWGGGMYLSEKYIDAPDTPLSQSMIGQSIPSLVLDNKLPWIPDLFIQVDAGWHFKTRPPGDVVAHIQTDPHVLKHTYDLPKSYSDFNFCMQTPYKTPDEYYLPYAYDPTIHYPENLDKNWDACMIGLQYQQRTALVHRLRNKGLKVLYDLGIVYDEYRKIYNQSKIALSWSSLDDLPARVWEAFGMGLPLVTNIVPDLVHFFIEGVHYLGFETVEEAESQVMLLLQDNEKREQIAQAGHEAVQSHTWDARVEQILKTTGMI